jgi:histidine triad (HIT) family protein
MAYDRNNIFARILRGEIPAHKVCEDAHTLAFMDVMPQADGHVLVIPKAEAENLFDLSPDALAATMLTTQRVARAVQRAFDAPGILIAQLNGPAAG